MGKMLNSRWRSYGFLLLFLAGISINQRNSSLQAPAREVMKAAEA